MLMDRITYWTGGHPYLTQRLCQAVAADDANLTAGSVDECAERLFLSAKAQRQDSNLSFVQQRMLPGEEEQRVGLLTLYAKVLSGKSVVDSDTVAFVSELKLAGIVQAVAGQLKVRNRIYAQVFDRAWISENMPGAELRRQRVAYRRGLFRAGVLASAVVGVMGCLTLWAIQSEQRANDFQIKSEVEKKNAERIAYIADMNLIPAAYEVNQFDRIGEILDVVITSVNRDDLTDGGSVHFAETVREVRQAVPAARVEVLTPDFDGNMGAVARVLDAGPHVFNHNMETVPRLYRRVRPQADYRQSLDVLRFARSHLPDVMTKSGFMVGLGETPAEVEQLLSDLREQDVDVATIGQYLQPTRRNLRVAEYVTPERFEEYKELGLSMGFKMVFSGPLVRSSYMADLVNEQAARA